MATAAQIAPGPTEVVSTPPRLVAAVGAARLRKLHAALLAAIDKGQAVTVRVEPHHGRAFKVLVAPEEAL